jgi:DNA invertase Pin-like site-specific DNA recombinase
MTAVDFSCVPPIIVRTLLTVKAAIYLRISSDRQDAANQELQVRALCTARGYTVDPRHVFSVTEKGDAERNPVKEACREAARRGEIKVIVTWALDRWTRGGIADLLPDVAQLKKWRVALVSVAEPWADTTDEGAGELMLAIAAWSARQEKVRLADRNRATAQRLRTELDAKGKLISKRSGKIFTRLGRPSVEVSPEARALVRALRTQPGTRYRSKPMGWPAVAARIASELGETYAASTLALKCGYLASESVIAIDGSMAPEHAA